MKITALSLAGLLLAGCSSMSGFNAHSSRGGKAKEKPKADLPETVIVTYHVLPGSEAALEKVLDRAWKIYEKDGMVKPSPHIIFQDKDIGADAKKFVEIFTWVSHAKPANPPADVTAIWKEMQPLCEPRGDQRAVDGGEIKLVAPTY